MKKIVIYSGRFQPFGPHHNAAYNWLCQKFGKDSVYIVTSNNVDENSPFDYHDKLYFMCQYGLDNNKIYKVKSPYKPVELLRYFNQEKTAVIFACGQKDYDRLRHGTYFKEYRDNVDLESFNKHGYVITIPHISIKTNGKEISGTTLRQLLPIISPTQFEDIMGWYTEYGYNLIKDRIIVTENVIKNIFDTTNLILERTSITRTQLQRIEQYADKLFQQFGIDINFQDLSKGTHFWERINDPRNTSPITQDELRILFKKASVKYGLKLSKQNDGAQGVLKDMETDINLPFIIKWDRDNQEIDLIPKTIMKKPNFTTPSTVYQMEGILREVFNSNTKNKHIMHLYEDGDLTFLDLIAIIDGLCSNKIPCYEKFDGQNLKVCYRDGVIKSARNKGNIVNPMSIDELRKKYETHVNSYLSSSFSEAHRIILLALSGLPDKVLNSIFKTPYTFLNFEILHPNTKNIYKYSDNPIIVLHGLIQYDEYGNEIEMYTKSADIIYKLLVDSGLSSIDNWTIIGPNKLSLNVTRSSIDSFINKLNDIIIKNHLSKNDKISQLIDHTDLIDWVHFVGTRMLMTINGELCESPYETKTFIKNQIKTIELDVINSNDVSKLNRFNFNREKLHKLNDMIIPFEGIVFIYKNKQYKLTGTFRYINQILGLFRYSR